MKKIVSFIVVGFIFLLMNTSCEDLFCDGTGTLQLTNKSLSTVQRIMINGVNYGSLDPGETENIELTPGVYAWQLVGISGGSGCSMAAVTITECDTQAFSCSAK